MTGDLIVQQGADFRHAFAVLGEYGEPRALTGWKAKAAIRITTGGPLVYAPAVKLTPGTATLAIPGLESLGWSFAIARYEVMLLGPRGERERLAAGRLLIDRTLVH